MQVQRDKIVSEIVNGHQPEISHTMVLVLTYDSPITASTVQALVDSHHEDEGMLRVQGALV